MKPELILLFLIVVLLLINMNQSKQVVTEYWPSRWNFGYERRRRERHNEYGPPRRAHPFRQNP